MYSCLMVMAAFCTNMQHRVNCTFLFSIKGQTVQNTTVISHFTYTLFWYNTRESTSKSYVPECLPEATDWYLGVKQRKWKQFILHCLSAQLIEVCNEKPLLFLQQIRKLRRELDASQEKVATLTSQLAANVSQMLKQRKASKYISSSVLNLVHIIMPVLQ